MQCNDEEAAALAANMEAVAGEPARFSDHSVGEEIVYHIGDEIRTGTIIFITPPQQVMSQHVPLTYLCDSGCGWPDYVYQSDIVEKPLWSLPSAD